MNAPANNLGQIRKLPIFTDLTEEELTEIDQLTDEVHIEQGRTIMRQGDLGQEFALIVSGEANIIKDDQVVARIGPGDYFGEVALLDSITRSASVVAATDMTLEVIDRRGFNTLLDDIPRLARALLRGIAHRLAEREEEIRLLEQSAPRRWVCAIDCGIGHSLRASGFQAAGFELVEVVTVGAVDIAENLGDGLIKLGGDGFADLTEFEERTGDGVVFDRGDFEFRTDGFDALGEAVVALGENDRGGVHAALVFEGDGVVGRVGDDHIGLRHIGEHLALEEASGHGALGHFHIRVALGLALFVLDLLLGHHQVLLGLFELVEVVEKRQAAHGDRQAEKEHEARVVDE